MTAAARHTKGWIPGHATGRVSDLPTPAMVVRDDLLQHNIESMASWCERQGVGLAPHGKTTMAPAIFERQLAAGAWGITVATIQQAAVALDAGAKNILIANELTWRGDLEWVAATAAANRDIRLVFCVD